MPEKFSGRPGGTCPTDCFLLLLRLQLELIVIKVDAADLDARDFILGFNRPKELSDKCHDIADPEMSGHR
jgi:hypothetical protein